jgi:CheY-like chemotaxis protein
MLVEDDPAIQRLYTRAFQKAGFDVTLAKDGTIVYEIIQLHRPDIIIMDVMMPNFNGLNALEELKTRPDTQNIPVIMLSANNDNEIVQKALQLGAARYLFKDTAPLSELIAVINEVLIKH